MKTRTSVSKAWALVGPPASARGHFKRAQRGLFAGDCIRFGDRLSPQHNRWRRCWRPNVHRVPLFSEALGARLAVRVTPTALGMVEQAGGLDGYIANQRVPESDMAAALRERILLARLFGVRLEPMATVADGDQTALKKGPPKIYPTLSSLRRDSDALLDRFLRARTAQSTGDVYCPG